ncbi:putative uncharacterized oxidoreductase [Paramyrothecium foliicola]|nr:putative uncharacterized oxidoreductase [Paramyrothecium foliicola]
MISPSEETILVTGANGYVTLHIINQLLQAGYNVRGTVRSQKASDQVRATFPRYWGAQLQIAFVTDLTCPESYNNILDDDVTGIIHAASPVHTNVDDNIRDMLDPAIKGSTAILEAVFKLPSSNVKRVVQLSSFSAILDQSQGFRPGHIYTDASWNPITFDQAAALKTSGELYLASKSLSERAAWDWVKQRNPTFDLVSINPSIIFGPHLNQIDSTKTTSTGAMLWSLIDAPLIPPLLFAGCVDVRDVGLITVAALKTSEAAGQRFLLAHHFDWQSAADAARAFFPQLGERIPVGEPGSGRKKSMETIYQADGSKVIRVLGIQYRPLEETVRDSLNEFIEVEKRTQS